MSPGNKGDCLIGSITLGFASNLSQERQLSVHRIPHSSGNDVGNIAQVSTWRTSPRREQVKVLISGCGLCKQMKFCNVLYDSWKSRYLRRYKVLIACGTSTNYELHRIKTLHNYAQHRPHMYNKVPRGDHLVTT